MHEKSLNKEISALIQRSEKWMRGYKTQSWFQKFSLPVLQILIFVALAIAITFFLTTFSWGKWILIVFISIISAFLASFIFVNTQDLFLYEPLRELGERYTGVVLNLPDLKKALDENDVVKAKYYLAYIYLGLGENKQALALLNEIKTKYEKSAGLYDGLARVNRELGKKEAAIQYFMQAIEIFPDDTDRIMEYVGLLIEEKKFFLAKEILVNSGEKSSDFYYNLGRAYDGLGEKEEAISHYSKYLEINKKDPFNRIVRKRIIKLKKKGV
ncbi:MAG: tetratricopeptide repeat protein [Candidatus Omnitrophica bacterium]|nr:tetratricopeptide repeat protein [Candidatus Omnitrophota bacterium]